MKAIELFAGVGGFRIGLERAGHEVIWSNEWDKYAADTYDKNFEGKINRESITDVRAEDIPEHDIICGGFPCQAFSIAGKRKGFAETRGTLFFDIMRIAQYHRTSYLFLENVKGLLSHDGGRTFETIIRTLDELGYDCQWQVLNSKDFGVPQNRERVFIVGHLRGKPRPKVFPLGSIEPETDELQGQHTNTLTTRYYEGQATGSYIIEGELDEQDLIQLNQPKHSNDRVYDLEGVAPTLNTMQGGNRQPFIATHYGFKDKPIENHGQISPTLKAQSHGHEPMVVQPFIVAERGRYNADGKTEQKVEARYDGLSNTLTGVEKDNRVVQPFVAMQWRRSEKGKQARRASQKEGRDYTPFSGDHRELIPKDGKPVGALTAQAIAKDSLLGTHTGLIRRLTPMECERLQGFPDGWTEGVSDTQRYKQMGNAVTVNVIKAIANKLKETV